MANAVQGSAHRGGPLPHRLRDEYGAGLGADLSSVRVHTDTAAAQLNDRLHSRAVTWGSDIYFAAGQYNPYTQTGRELIAHETVHSVQQGFGRDPAAMRLQCAPDESKDEVLEALAQMEQGADLEELQQQDEFRAEIGGRLELQLQTTVDTIRKYVLEYEQEYERRIAAETAEATGVTVAPEVAALHVELNDEAVAAERRVRDAIANQHAAGEDTSFLEVQAEYIEVVRMRHSDQTVSKAATVLFGADVMQGPIVGYLRSMPIATETEGQRAVYERSIQEQKALTGNLAAEIRLLDKPKISIGFWKDVLNAGTPQEEQEDAEQEKLDGLTPLERKILEANRLLDRRKATGTDGITLSLADIEEVTGGSQAEQEIDAHLSQAEALLVQLEPEHEGSASIINFSLIREALRALQAEMVMFRGLLRGASSRYPQLKGLESDINDSIEQFFEALRESMLEDLGIDLLLQAIPAVGSAVAIARKIEKVVSTIRTMQEVLSITDTLQEIVGIVDQARAQIGAIEAKLQQIDEVASEAEYEELVFQLIDEYSLLDYMVLPDFAGLSEAEIQDEVLKIVRDVPSGLVAFGDMFSLYKSLTANMSDEELAALAVTSITAGLLLAPVVAFLAFKALEKIGSGIAKLDKSFLDRINPLNRRHRKRHKRLEDQQEETKQKIEEVRTDKYDYQPGPVKAVLADQYKPELERALHDTNNSFGAHAWTAGYFKYFVTEEVRELNAKRGSRRVRAKIKGKKEWTTAPMLELTKLKFTDTAFPWRAMLGTSKTSVGTVDVVPDTAHFHKLDYAHFAGAGIAYDTGRMTGKHDLSRKRDEIDKWLLEGYEGRKHKYQFTYGVDPLTGAEQKTEDNKFIRIPGADTKPGFLQIDDGFIKQGVNQDAYKAFLGKKLSGTVKSKVNADTVTSLLPPGYYAYKDTNDEIVVAKKLQDRSGAQAEQKLAWDLGRLMEASDPIPRVVSHNTLQPGDITYEKLSDAQVDEMVDNMFAKDPSGAVKTPEQLAPDFKEQDSKKTRPQWHKYIDKHETELKFRPKTVNTELGYTVNQVRGSLGHLPELKKTDDKGHLVAARFNGPDSLGNLVPMNTALNQAGGKWYEIEGDMALPYVGRGAVPKDSVQLRVTLNYGRFVRRPDSFDVDWAWKRGSSPIKSDRHHGISNP